MLYLGKTQGIDDSLSLHYRIGSLTPVQEIVALHDLLKLFLVKAGHIEVAQSVTKHPRIFFKESLPERFVPID